MTTLEEFLLARIADDERIAEAASGVISGPAQFGHHLWTWGDQRLEITKARVLAECEAKRRQINHLIIYLDGDYAPQNAEQLRMMAAVYADHPGYDPAWAL